MDEIDKPLCWSCEHVHYENNWADPQCLKRCVRLIALPTPEEGCADFTSRTSWGVVFCPVCLGSGSDGTLRVLRVEDGTGAHSAVCTHDPAHHWPLHLPARTNLDRCQACGGFFTVAAAK